MIGMGMILERAITSFKLSAADETEDRGMLMIEAEEIMHYIRTLELMNTISAKEASKLECYMDAVLHEYFN